MSKLICQELMTSVYGVIEIKLGYLWHKVRTEFSSYIMMLFLSPCVYADPSQIPLSINPAGQPNILVILDNSNTMDEDSDGVAQGSNCPSSKSEIARAVIENMTSSYAGEINMGLMTYQLSSVSNMFIHNSEYDVSYNPANYSPLTTNSRASPLKSYRIQNPTGLLGVDYIYYNFNSPYYDAQNQGVGFCYSPTANAAASINYPNGFNNGENLLTGPWDSYRCFKKKIGSSDQLPIWQNLVSETTQGYSLFNYQNGFLPSPINIADGIVDFGKQQSWRFVGSAYYASTSPGHGYLQTPMAALTLAQSNAIGNLLACNVPQTTPATCIQNAQCTNMGIKNAGNTPTQGTLQTANDYFSGILNDPFQGYLMSTYPLPVSCGNNVVILVTDGLPDTDMNGNIVVDPIGVPTGTTATNAAAISASNLLNSGVKTYVVGFGSGIKAPPLNAIANAGGTVSSYFASDYPTLANALDSIFHVILSTPNSVTTLAASASNETQLNAGTLFYQAKYNAVDWSGQLFASNVNANTGTLTIPSLWEASSLLPIIGRHIYSYNPSMTSGGISFLWSNLTITQQTYLNTFAGFNDGKGADRLAWLSGDQSQEQLQGGVFRNRTNVLGDIVNSNSVYVGSKDYGYGVLLGAEGSSYNTYINSSAYINRTAMLYVGANDGMLHGFDASSNSTGGQELFAYVPNALYPKLSHLTSPNYVHEFYVDGLSGVGDVYDGSAWHTLLAGASGAGGKALFALDVTTPNNFSASQVLWEFTSIAPSLATDCSAWGATSANYDINDLGYTLGQPSVVRLQDGHWVILAANGYNSANGHAVLFILDAKSGCVIQKLDTFNADISGLATVNGLSSPIAIDTNNDLSVDTVYAGDLHGNFWKFDVSGSAGSYLIPNAPFFVACTTSGSCASANRQAITAKPNVGPAGGVGTDQNEVGWMIYFGTGQYFEPSDNMIGSNAQVQSLYGLWDQGTVITDRTLLQTQTITYEGLGTLACSSSNTCPTGTPTTTSQSIAVVSKNAVCYAQSSAGCTATSPLKKGWVLDLYYSSAQGERIVSAPLVSNGLVVFSTLIPSANPCAAGGTSNLIELGAFNGGQSSIAPFDINGDGVVNSQDQVLVNGVSQFVSGINLAIGIINTPTLMASTTVNYNYISGSMGAMAIVTGAGVGSSGAAKRSWHQLK